MQDNSEQYFQSPRIMITEDLKSAVETMLLAQAYHDTIKPVVETYQQEILDREKFPIKDSHVERMIERNNQNPKTFVDTHDQSYRMNDDDFDRYMQLLHEQHIEHGFDVELDYCPLLMAKNSLIKAQNLVIDECEYMTNVKRKNVWKIEHREKLLNLTVGLVLSLCPDIQSQSILDKAIG